MQLYNIGIIGATGVVGKTLLNILEVRNFPINNLYLIASNRNKGKKILFKGSEITVQTLDTFDFGLIDIAFGCAGSDITKTFIDKIAAHNCILIDEASYLRRDEQIPLVIPEINANTIAMYTNKNIIAGPNCCATPIALVLQIILQIINKINDIKINDIKINDIKRVVVSTYQSCSGAGKFATDELLKNSSLAIKNNINIHDHLQEHHLQEHYILPKDISFNVVPQVGKIIRNETTNNIWQNYTDEEEKIAYEVRKILDKPINISVTSVRVPVVIGHSFSCNIELNHEITEQQLEQLKITFNNTSMTRYNDEYLTPKEIAGTDFVHISRLRKSPFDPKVIDLWFVCDNLRKGAALNSVQIAEYLIKNFNIK